MCTLLPALLAIGGRRAFWPFIPRFGDEGADETHGFWRRVGERVAGARGACGSARSPLLACCRWPRCFNTDLTTGNQFRNEESSTRGQELVAQAFPAGANVPTNVIVPDPAEVHAVRAALRAAPGGGRARAGRDGPAGGALRRDAAGRSLRTRRFDLVPELRDAARASGRRGVLIGGPTAEERDLREAAERDTCVIVPLVLLVVFVVLALLLRAVRAAGDPDRNRGGVVPGGARGGSSSSRTSSTSPGSTPRCRCWRSSSWWRWGSTTTSS